VNNGKNGRQILRPYVLVAIGVVFLVVCILLRRVLTPVLVALVLAYIADPLLGWLERHRVRRWVATTLLYTVCLALAFLGVVTLGPRIASQAQRLYRDVSGFAKDYGTTVLDVGGATDGPKQSEEIARPATVGTNQFVVSEEGPSPAFLALVEKHMPEWGTRAQDYLRENADEIASRIVAVTLAVARNAAKGLSNAANFMFGLILVLVFSFFFMLHFRAMTGTIRRYIPLACRDQALRIISKIDAAVSNFFRGRLMVCLVAAVVYVIGLRISGIDFWLLIGLAGGILGFVPILGVILPLIPACAFALLSPHPWASLVGVLITFSLVQWVVEPLAGMAILSKQVKMHPVTILLALLVGGALFGFFGILLSVPLAAVTKILGEEFLLPPLREMAADRKAAGSEDEANRDML